MKYTFVSCHKSIKMKKNRENSDIIDKFILYKKEINVLINIDQYNIKYIYMITVTICLGQLNE